MRSGRERQTILNPAELDLRASVGEEIDLCTSEDSRIGRDQSQTQESGRRDDESVRGIRVRKRDLSTLEGNRMCHGSFLHGDASKRLSRGSPPNFIRPFSARRSVSHTLMEDSQSSWLGFLSARATRGISLSGASRLHSQMWVSRRSFTERATPNPSRRPPALRCPGGSSRCSACSRASPCRSQEPMRAVPLPPAVRSE